jgi:hypothetical protein
VRQRDKAHGCRRVLSRAWQSDPYLKHIIEKLVLDSGAIAQRIRFSSVFRMRFNKFVQDLTGNQRSRIKDLASAKHRFCSHSMPLGRAVLYFVPLLRCAQSILDERGHTSKEGRDAFSWLSMLDDEAALQMALMADCSDEGMMLVRFLDGDDYDKTELSVELQRFLRRATWLFEHRGALTTGYTQHMVGTLKVRRMVFLDKLPKHLGGPGSPSAATVDRCFQRMCNWLQLARHTIKAECPEFETLQSFSCFGLAVPVCDHHFEMLKKLSNVLQLNYVQLRAQFEDIRTLAQRHFDAGAPNHVAWQKAVEDATRSSRTREAHPCGIITQALARHIAWNAGTSTVERDFGKAYCSSSTCRADIGEDRLDDEVQLVSLDPGDSSIFEEARHVWASCYGAPRASPTKPRLDTGKRKREDPCSEAGFLRNRRSSVLAAAACVDGDVALPHERTVGEQGWEASHQAEIEFQLSKRRVRLLECIEEGGVLPSEVTPEITLEHAAHRDLEAKRQRDYNQKHSRTARAIAAPQFPNLAGQSCYSTVLCGELDNACRRLQIVPEEDYLKARVYVVDDIIAPRMELLWPAMLDGKLMCDKAYLVSSGARGLSLKYKAATQIARAMFITPQFAAAHPVKAAELLWHSSARHGAGSRWVHVEHRDTFLQAAQKAIAAKKPTQVIVFMVAAEEAEFANVKLKFTGADGFAGLSAIDRLLSATGTTGRGVQWE